jgi:hypothetical protein
MTIEAERDLQQGSSRRDMLQNITKGQQRCIARCEMPSSGLMRVNVVRLCGLDAVDIIRVIG